MASRSKQQEAARNPQRSKEREKLEALLRTAAETQSVSPSDYHYGVSVGIRQAINALNTEEEHGADTGAD